MSDTTGVQTTTIQSDRALRPEAYVSLDTVRQNYLALKNFASGSETAAVVKADCYGHGMNKCAPALRDAGCTTFFVAYLHEGQELRSLLGSSPEILVFNGIQKDEVSGFVDSNLIPVCNRREDIDLVLGSALSDRYAIHFDTGMNRLGIRFDQFEDIAARTKACPPTLVMSHVACADQPDHPLNGIQLDRFNAIADAFPEAQKSLSATAAMYLGPEYHFDLTRPGIGLYGGGPARPVGLKLKTALTLTAPILSVFDVPEGESVGYGASFSARSATRIATVALGYADGYLRSGGNYGFGVLDGLPCPIVGRISMDLITIDVSDLPNPPEIGKHVEFIGAQAGYEIQAEALGTLGYELTSRLGGRISRSWDK